jgi:hypothetical protein
MQGYEEVEQLNIKDWLCPAYAHQMSHGSNSSMITRLLFIILAISTISFLGIAI